MVGARADRNDPLLPSGTPAGSLFGLLPFLNDQHRRWERLKRLSLANRLDLAARFSTGLDAKFEVVDPGRPTRLRPRGRSGGARQAALREAEASEPVGEGGRGCARRGSED